MDIKWKWNAYSADSKETQIFADLYLSEKSAFLFDNFKRYFCKSKSEDGTSKSKKSAKICVSLESA